MYYMFVFVELKFTEAAVEHQTGKNYISCLRDWRFLR